MQENLIFKNIVYSGRSLQIFRTNILPHSSGITGLQGVISLHSHCCKNLKSKVWYCSDKNYYHIRIPKYYTHIRIYIYIYIYICNNLAKSFVWLWNEVFFTLTEKHKVQMCLEMVTREKFGSKGHEVIGKFRILSGRLIWRESLRCIQLHLDGWSFRNIIYWSLLFTPWH
jgi:hypothetical protein